MFQNHLDGGGGIFIDQFIGLPGFRKRYFPGNEACRPDAPDHIPGDIEAPFARPAGRKVRGQRADLAADQAQASAVKAAAQVEGCRFAAVARTNDDAAVKPGDGNGLVQGLGIA
jgi:hypothetical protein